VFCWSDNGTRLALAAALLMPLLLILGGCGDPPRPFQPSADAPVNELLVLADPAGIIVDDIADLPPAGQKKFMTAVVDELQRAEVPAYLGQGNAQSFRLKGQVLEFGTGANTDVQIYWLLVDASGKSLGNHQVRRQIDAKAWKAGDPGVLTQLARESSQGIAKLMPDYRVALAERPARPVKLDTNVNSIVPPSGTGVGRAPKPAQTAQAAPGGKPGQSSPQDKAPPPPQAAQGPASDGKAAAAKPADAMAVALRPIEGAPGDGAQALNRAMRQYLGRAGIPVVEENQNPAASIAGKVTLTDLGQQQEVRVDWSVFAPDGRRLGTISQANKIPAGRLNGPWGGIAGAVAENAVQGLSDLFDQIATAPPAPGPGRAPSTAQAPPPK